VGHANTVAMTPRSSGFVALPSPALSRQPSASSANSSIGGAGTDAGGAGNGGKGNGGGFFQSAGAALVADRLTKLEAKLMQVRS